MISISAAMVTMVKHCFVLETWSVGKKEWFAYKFAAMITMIALLFFFSETWSFRVREGE